jgi:hypothetical protein
MIILEYEHSYEMKFSKAPKLVKKMDDTHYYEQLKKNAMKQKQINSNINNNTKEKIDECKPPIPNKRTYIMIQQILKEEMIKINHKKSKKNKMKKIHHKVFKFRVHQWYINYNKE